MPFGSVCVAMLLAVAQTQAPDPHRGAFTRGLGVTCDHCHDASGWTTSSRPAFDMAARMERMVAGLNAGALSSRGGITCFTCHRGAATPSRMPRDAWQPIFDDWPATATVSEADANRPAREVYRNLKALGDMNAGNLRLTMSVFAGALGVNCEYCHAGDEWDSDNKPAKRSARDMLAMFGELPKYFEGIKAPSFQCYSCHQGGTSPQR